MGLDPASRDLLIAAANRAHAYLAGLDARPVQPRPDAVDSVGTLGGPLPLDGLAATEVLELLDRFGSPATIASAGARYFGFVTGGALPAALAANWLAGAWDQNAFSETSSPAGALIEATAERWVADLLGFPAGTGVGFVTGATGANLAGLAAARTAVLERVGWNVRDQGLYGAPEITVIVGDEVHASLLKALGILGLGRERVVRVPVDGQGRMQPDGLPPIEGPTIVCLQAGNVNTGAFDPAEVIIPAAHARGAWVHVDGAFGLWAAAAPWRAHLTAGYAQADSAAVDGHKWLNVPYDCGFVLVRDPMPLRLSMAVSAAYLPDEDVREPYDLVPEASRRARGVDVWAAIRSLGRSGVAEMIERGCHLAGRFAKALEAEGFTVLNDVVLNQVLVSFGDPERTLAVIDGVQKEGTCWAGGSEWQGHTAMRISVSGWSTTEEDVDRSVAAIASVARGLD